MKYLIFIPDQKPFQTQWFDVKNHWIDGMVVINTLNFSCMVEKGKWVAFSDVDQDHL